MTTGNVMSEAAARRSMPEGEVPVNEIFHSLQGEGSQSGLAMTFIRFADCNLRCTISNAGFDCDTEFMSGKGYSTSALIDAANALCSGSPWVLFTGGEPGLWLTLDMVTEFHDHGFYCAVETNGTIDLSGLYLDHVTVSPKSALHTIRQTKMDALKVVRRFGQKLFDVPASWKVKDKFVSPAFRADGRTDDETLRWCIDLCLQNPGWRLSMQMHKLWGVR